MNLKMNLIQGDCQKIMKKIPSESVDLLVTDPPYFVLERLKDEKIQEKADWDHFPTLDDFVKFSEKWLGECYRLLKPNSQGYVFWSQKYMKNFWNMNQPFEIKRMLLWHHSNMTRKFSSAAYVWTYDPIFYLVKGKAEKFNASFLKKENVDVFNFAAPQTNFDRDKQYHFLQKPYNLMSILIKNSSNPGDTVIDPFLGAGTTMKAARDLKRSCIGIEINSKYIGIVKQRLNWGISLNPDVEFKFEEDSE